MMPPSGIGNKAKWIGPALILAGATVLVALLLDPRPDRDAFELGVFYALGNYDQALPLLGTGLALARGSLRVRILGVALFLVGIPVESFLSDWLVIALRSHPGLIGYVSLTRPACCIVVGISLAVPQRLLSWLAPPAALFSGATLGLVISLNDPTIAAWSFAGGAVLAGLWLVLVPILVWRQFAKPWFSIPSRVFGSWLIAIGAMLVAVVLLPRPVPQELPPPANPLDRTGKPPLTIEAPEAIPEAPPPANPLALPDNVQ